MTDKVLKKKYPVKGTVQKYWFYASSLFCKALDSVVISSGFAILAAWLLGPTHLIVIFFAIGLVAFLVRMGLTAYNYNKARYSPIEAEYRITMLEDQLNGILGELV